MDTERENRFKKEKWRRRRKLNKVKSNLKANKREGGRGGGREGDGKR